MGQAQLQLQLGDRALARRDRVLQAALTCSQLGHTASSSDKLGGLLAVVSMKCLQRDLNP